MELIFADVDKKVKSSFLKELENNNKILKNLFDEVYIDDAGLTFCVESKITNGRVYCYTSLNKLFNIEENTLFKLNTGKVTECLKGGKTKITGYYTDDMNNLVISTTDKDYIIGYYEKDKKINFGYMEEIINNVNYSCNLNELLERFENKEFINIKKDKYDLILTHKLFPAINKAVSFDFSASDLDDGTFYGLFKNHIEERNKKDEITFEMNVYYIYRFMDLN